MNGNRLGIGSQIRKSLGVIALGALLAGIPGQVSAEDFSSRIGRVEEPAGEQVEEGLDENSFGSAELGFSVEWDADVWLATEPEDAEGGGASLVSERSQGIIVGFPVNRDSMEECVDVSATGIEGTTIYSDFGPASASYDRPEFPDDAHGELYIAEVEESGEEIMFYIECREVEATNTIVFSTFGTFLPDYETELPAWQAVFDSIVTVDE
jgi:hypothetical protein